MDAAQTSNEHGFRANSGLRCRMALTLALAVVAVAAPAARATDLPAGAAGALKVTAGGALQPPPLDPPALKPTPGDSLPTWSGTELSPVDGVRYPFTMIGNDPTIPELHPVTVIPTDFIPIRFAAYASGGFGPLYVDPTMPDAACLASPTIPSGATPFGLALQSPLFVDHDYKFGSTDVGNVQYVDAFQRMNFGRHVLGPLAINPGYKVELSVTQRPVVTVIVPPADGLFVFRTDCGPEISIDKDWWKSEIENVLFRRLRAYINPRRFPIFFAYRMDLTNNGRTLGGFHNAAKNPAWGGDTQTFATAVYSPGEDIAGLSHEVAEWMDDPFAGNQVPAWGPIGQVSSCSRLLEVGDPITGHLIPVTMSNGITYHPQELAFFGWFFRVYSPFSPSPGLPWYSDNGTFTSDAGPVCSATTTTAPTSDGG
jgi:hypothetical protein